MHRRQLLEKLIAHRPIDIYEAGFLQHTKHFVSATPNCFERTHLAGHVTGSAWIISPDRSKAILLHHQKLNQWFQPGGHADGESDILNVAITEAIEETGLTINQLTTISEAIFDIDVHRIPALKDVPAHNHFDIRFLFEASPDVALPGNYESHEIGWFPINQIQMMNNTASCRRLVIKTRQMRC